MTINGQDKRFGLKIEEDKITLIGVNDIVKMSLDEAHMLGQILSEQSNNCIKISNARNFLTIE